MEDAKAARSVRVWDRVPIKNKAEGLVLTGASCCRTWLSSERSGPSDVLHKTLQTYSKKILKNPQEKNKLKDWYTPGVDEKDILDGILACQRENFWWDVGLRKRFKYASITLISILFVAILAMGLWKNEEITELLCRLAFVIPMIKWLLLDTVKKLNKDISILQELDGDINNNEMKTMEDLQDIQKVIFQHRKGCYAIPEIIYNIFKDNDEDRAYREARM